MKKKQKILCDWVHIKVMKSSKTRFMNARTFFSMTSACCLAIMTRLSVRFLLDMRSKIEQLDEIETKLGAHDGRVHTRNERSKL